jgi:hypothetical protein
MLAKATLSGGRGSKMDNVNSNFIHKVAACAPYLPAGTPASLTTSYDEHGDVLYIDLAPGATAMNSQLDEEEIFVFRPSEDAEAVRFAVPFFRSYWRNKPTELLDHLTRYAPGHQRAMASGLAGLGIAGASKSAAASL